MQDLEKAMRELERSGKVDALRALAGSPDGQRLSRSIDQAALEKAVKTGDSAALQQILRGVLSTGEGRRLAEEL
ncbi:MAG: hypothetical protein IK095_00755, partial [Oscillospiraceae bacterium]|nr:hypothetical protein [Oscillospiraceae bacterium]